MSRADEISSTFLVVFRQAELLAKERGTGQMSSISVALIDDHPLMLDAISSLLRRTEGFEIVGTGATPLDVVEICKNSRPDIVIIEPLLAGDPYTAISNALKISPLTRILAYTGATGVEPAIRALDAGARGYVLKRSNVAELIQGVSSVHAGETYITQSFASRVIGGLRDASLRRKAAEAVVLNIREQQLYSFQSSSLLALQYLSISPNREVIRHAESFNGWLSVLDALEVRLPVAFKLVREERSGRMQMRVPAMPF